MSNQTVLDTVINIRQQLLQPRYDKGELNGYIVLSPVLITQLKTLAAAGITENVIAVNKESVAIEKISPGVAGETKVPVTLYTRNISPAGYYETVQELIEDNPYSYPAGIFYVQEIRFISTGPNVPPVIDNYKDVLRFIEVLSMLSDYVISNIGEPKELVFFNKRKLSILMQYNQNALRPVPYLDQLLLQLQAAHDNEERKRIFVAELISFLLSFSTAERFVKLLTSLDAVYDNYLKSHLLYLEKFSYHDLKSKVDKDKLEYTKKIYATVNDIQSKLIAVPAAFLLVLAQFDFTNKTGFKNILITIGALLFSILLEVLLSNQFGVLKYIETEILQFNGELKNADTSIDLSAFINSFYDLKKIANRQRTYLWIFRIIVWLVPLFSLIMLVYKK